MLKRRRLSLCTPPDATRASNTGTDSSAAAASGGTGTDSQVSPVGVYQLTGTKTRDNCTTQWPATLTADLNVTQTGSSYAVTIANGDALAATYSGGALTFDFNENEAVESCSEVISGHSTLT